jgi:hypothetical protein
LLHETRECRVDIVAAARILDDELQSERLRRCLRVAHLGLGSWIFLVDQKPDHSRVWNQLVEQLQPFGRECVVQKGRSSDIAARSVKAGNETEFDCVAADREHDRNDRCRSLAASGAAALASKSDVSSRHR